MAASSGYHLMRREEETHVDLVIQEQNEEEGKEKGTYKVMNVDTNISEIKVLRGLMLMAVAMTYVDMSSDGGVMVTFLRHGKTAFACLLAASIVVPQIVIWIFLHHNGMANIRSLGRMLMFPTIAGVILAITTYCFTAAPDWLTNASLFSICISLEPAFHLFEGWALGKEPPSLVWMVVQENLLEAPCSLVLTLYPLLFDSLLQQTLDPSASLHLPWFVIFSLISSVINISKGAAKLHFIGKSPTMTESVAQLLVKAPLAVAQLSTLVLVALMTRSNTETTTETDIAIEQHTYRQWLVLMFLLLQLVINASVLYMVAPGIGHAVLALLCSTMIVAGPPGFLYSLGRMRRPFATIQFALQVFAGVICLLFSPLASKMFQNILSGCPWLFGIYIISVPLALVATFWDTQVTGNAADTHITRAEAARGGLMQAIEDKDMIMMNLMLEIDGAIPDKETFKKAADVENLNAIVMMFDHGYVSIYEDDASGACGIFKLSEYSNQPWIQTLQQYAFDARMRLMECGS